jgi:protein gp37
VLAINKTKIEYLDYTLNVVVGCSAVDCAVAAKCYARGQAKRQKHRCPLCYRFIPHFHDERLDEPFHVQKPSRIGLNFMGETFDKEFMGEKDRFDRIWNGIKWMTIGNSEHTFVIFTKQPQNIMRYGNLDFPKNIWLCVSVNCLKDLWRIDELRKTNAFVKGVSFEPLYEDLGIVNLDGISWVIIGAQTRPKLLPREDWVKKLIGQAEIKKIPIFVKDNLSKSYEWMKAFKQFPRLER